MWNGHHFCCCHCQNHYLLLFLLFLLLLKTAAQHSLSWSTAETMQWTRHVPPYTEPGHPNSLVQNKGIEELWWSTFVLLGPLGLRHVPCSLLPSHGSTSNSSRCPHSLSICCWCYCHHYDWHATAGKRRPVHWLHKGPSFPAVSQSGQLHVPKV